MLTDEILNKIDYVAARVVPRFLNENCVNGFSIKENDEELELIGFHGKLLYLHKNKFQSDLYRMFIFQAICEYKCIELNENELDIILEFQEAIPKYNRRTH